MLENANKDITNDIKFTEGDYVFLHEQPTGQGQKLKPKFSGPFVVHAAPSDHMVKLSDPSGKRQLTDCVLKDRLKHTFIRQPSPSSYFKVIASRREITVLTKQTQTLEKNVSQVHRKVRRSKRRLNKPIRFRGADHVDPDAEIPTFSMSSDSDGYHKIKRVLAQRKKWPTY